MKRNSIVAMGSRFVLATTLGAVASLILACGSSYPSQSAARTVLENMGRKENLDLFTVRTFTKTNGKGDDKRYILEYDAELKCGGYRGVWGGYGEGCASVRGDMDGHMIKESGSIPFEKTEKGWRGPDGNVY